MKLENTGTTVTLQDNNIAKMVMKIYFVDLTPKNQYSRGNESLDQCAAYKIFQDDPVYLEPLVN